MRDRKRLILLRSSVPMTFSYTTETTLSNFYGSLKYSKYRGHTQRKWLWKKRKKNRKRLLSSDEKLFNLFCFTVLSVFNEVKVSLVYHCVTYKSMYGRTTNSSHQAISRRSSYFQQTALHVLQVAGTKYVAEIKVPKPNWVFATCWDILFLQTSPSFHKANCCHGFFSLPITVVRVQVCFGIKLFNY